jgi:hypothetical protein
MVEMKHTYKVPTQKFQEMRTLGGNRHRLDHKEMGCRSLNCSHMAHNKIQWQALLNVEINLHDPKCGEILTI